MQAKVGDWLVIKSTTMGESDRRGLITEVHSADGSPPYLVRWLDTDHVASRRKLPNFYGVSGDPVSARRGGGQGPIRHGTSVPIRYPRSVVGWNEPERVSPHNKPDNAGAS
ncbi:hypothetical protein AWC22_18025 [Mycobacterium riyadhense]|uniref:DUF1918 domain-containing protein n=1 Tax=Mycobacterium riyadhense TaxID=486698 RepID=A0A1X2CWX9_9MYCO|nr:DUF1918 domain-containing protein [Mycobacterium riyadhense]ORW80331.1 hypothetical protein AWC22_18025 [Mycobacterium riyadhense]